MDGFEKILYSVFMDGFELYYLVFIVLFVFLLKKIEDNDQKRKKYPLLLKYEKIYKSLTINERIQWVQKELNNEKNKNR